MGTATARNKNPLGHGLGTGRLGRPPRNLAGVPVRCCFLTGDAGPHTTTFVLGEVV
jgi:hypothetical protein